MVTHDGFDIGFVVFPGMTQLDFTGPFEVLSRLSTPPSLSTPSKFPGVTTHVVAKMNRTGIAGGSNS